LVGFSNQCARSKPKFGSASSADAKAAPRRAD
jgi:hypothetical protein